MSGGVEGMGPIGGRLVGKIPRFKYMQKMFVLGRKKEWTGHRLSG